MYIFSYNFNARKSLSMMSGAHLGMSVGSGEMTIGRGIQTPGMAGLKEALVLVSSRKVCLYKLPVMSTVNIISVCRQLLQLSLRMGN